MRDASQAGFTLIEVTVALVILALSVGVLYEEFAGAMTRSAHASDRDQALLLAQSLLAQLRAAPQPWSAESSGRSDEGWSWRVTTIPFDAGTQGRTAWRALEVTVRVSPVEHPTREVMLRSVELARSTP